MKNIIEKIDKLTDIISLYLPENTNEDHDEKEIDTEKEIDQYEKTIEDMLDLIESLDPEQLSDEQLITIDQIVKNLETVEKELEETGELSEQMRKWVLRKGKKFRKLICKPGWRAKGNKCVIIPAATKIKMKRGAIKSARKRKFKKAKIVRALKKALRRRKAMGL